MKLEQQIEKLSDIGLSLNKGVTINDLLLSYSREEYESSPFDLILFVYGIEVEEGPEERFVCDQAWNFDVEAIEDDGSYTEIVKQFHRITGKAKNLKELRDSVNLDEQYAELQYSVDGIERLLKPKIDDDWADPKTIEIILSDLRQPGFDFYQKDNGQASIWFYLSESQAIELNKLANNVFDLERKPWWKVW